MSINKNFVVRNGLEISTDLIIADATTRKVGIGTTVAQYLFHVNGGIGVTDVYVSGITTVINELRVGTGGTIFSVIAGPTGSGQSIGVGTALPAFLLDIRSPVSTGQTALYVQGDIRVTGDLSIDDISITNLNVSGISTFVGFATFQDYVFIQDGLNVTGAGATLTSLNVTGVSTFGGYVDINNSVDIGVDLNVSGVSTLGGYVDINNSVDIGVDLNVSGVSTLGGYVDINNSVDISGALNVTGVSTFGGYVDINNSVDISGALNVTGVSTFGGYVDINSSVDIGVDLNVSGVSTLGGYVDINNSVDISGNLNVVGIATITNITGPDGTITNINSTNANLTNIFSTDLNVTGISTLGTVVISSGIITAISGIVTYYGDGQYLTNILSGVGISSLGTLIGIGATILNFIGTAVSTVTVSSGIATIKLDAGAGGGGSPGGTDGQVQYNNFGVFGGSSNFTFDGSNVNVTGIITATSFFGSGANLTGLVAGVGIATAGGTVGTGATILDFRGAGISTVTVSSGIATINVKGFSVTNDTSTNSTYYPVYVDATTGTPTQISVSSTNLQFNPSTGTFSATQFTSLSDKTQKTNIRLIENSVELVKQLEGVRYDWINNNKPSIGVIAQDIEKVLPEVVTINNDGLKSVSYGNIVGVLIEAIKELKTEIETLKNIINK